MRSTLRPFRQMVPVPFPGFRVHSWVVSSLDVLVATNAARAEFRSLALSTFGSLSGETLLAVGCCREDPDPIEQPARGVRRPVLQLRNTPAVPWPVGPTISERPSGSGQAASTAFSPGVQAHPAPEILAASVPDWSSAILEPGAPLGDQGGGSGRVGSFHRERPALRAAGRWAERSRTASPPVVTIIWPRQQSAVRPGNLVPCRPPERDFGDRAVSDFQQPGLQANFPSPCRLSAFAGLLQRQPASRVTRATTAACATE